IFLGTYFFFLTFERNFITREEKTARAKILSSDEIFARAVKKLFSKKKIISWTYFFFSYVEAHLVKVGCRRCALFLDYPEAEESNRGEKSKNGFLPWRRIFFHFEPQNVASAGQSWLLAMRLISRFSRSGRVQSR